MNKQTKRYALYPVNQQGVLIGGVSKVEGDTLPELVAKAVRKGIEVYAQAPAGCKRPDCTWLTSSKRFIVGERRSVERFVIEFEDHSELTLNAK